MAADGPTRRATSLTLSPDTNIPSQDTLHHNDARTSNKNTQRCDVLGQEHASFNHTQQPHLDVVSAQPKQKQYDEENVSLLSTSCGASTSSASLYSPSRRTTGSSTRTQRRGAYRIVPGEADDVPALPFPLPVLHGSTERPALSDEADSTGYHTKEALEAERQMRLSSTRTSVGQAGGHYHGIHENYQMVSSELYNAHTGLSPEALQESFSPKDVSSDSGTFLQHDLESSGLPKVKSVNEMYHSALRREATRAKVQECHIYAEDSHVVNNSDPSGNKTKRMRLTRMALVFVGFAWSAAGTCQSFVTAKAVTAGFTGDDTQDKMDMSDAPALWLTSAYLVAFGAFILPASRLQTLTASNFATSAAGSGWMAFWSIAAGFSSYASGGVGMALLCVCRAMQGVGASVVTTSGHSILCDVGKDLWQGKIAAVATFLGALFGAVMATLLASFDAGWRWMYFCLGAWSTALFAFSFWLACRDCYNGPCQRFRRGRSLEPLWKRLDVPGSVLLIICSTLSVSGWNQLGAVGFTTTYPYVLIIIGALFIVALVFWEREMLDPLLPMDDVTDGRLFSVLGLVMTASMAFAIWALYTTRIAEDVLHYSAIETCIGVTLAAIASITTSLVVQTMRTRLPVQMLYLAATLLLASGMVCSIGATLGHQPLVLIMLGLILAPAGTVALFHAAMDVASNCAVSTLGLPLILSLMMVSSALGLGLAGTVEQGVGESSLEQIAEFRGALYFGIGMAGLSVGTAAFFLLRWPPWRRSERA